MKEIRTVIGELTLERLWAGSQPESGTIVHCDSWELKTDDDMAGATLIGPAIRICFEVQTIQVRECSREDEDATGRWVDIVFLSADQTGRIVVRVGLRNNQVMDCQVTSQDGGPPDWIQVTLVLPAGFGRDLLETSLRALAVQV